MLFTIHTLIVPSAPITMGITSVFIFHIRCISTSRSSYLLFFSISLLDTFLSHGSVMSTSLQVEFTLSLIIISGLFALICLSVCTAMPHSTVCVSVLVTVSGWCSYQLSLVLISRSLQIFECKNAAALLCLSMYSTFANTSHPDVI